MCPDHKEIWLQCEGWTNRCDEEEEEVKKEKEMKEEKKVKNVFLCACKIRTNKLMVSILLAYFVH